MVMSVWMLSFWPWIMPCVSAPNGTTDNSLAARTVSGSVPLERSASITIGVSVSRIMSASIASTPCST
eukprot:4230927-Prymnesium_polylepis.1